MHLEELHDQFCLFLPSKVAVDKIEDAVCLGWWKPDGVGEVGVACDEEAWPFGDEGKTASSLMPL